MNTGRLDIPSLYLSIEWWTRQRDQVLPEWESQVNLLHRAWLTGNTDATNPSKRYVSTYLDDHGDAVEELVHETITPPHLTVWAKNLGFVKMAFDYVYTGFYTGSWESSP
jgi:hypothetical protein